MDIFTIITTLLSLLLSAISTAISIAGFKATPGSPPPVSAPASGVSTPQPNPTSSILDIQKDNRKFKDELLYWTVIIIVTVILILWGIYGWKHITVPPIADFPLLNYGEKISHMIYFSLFYTLRCIIWVIPIFSIGMTAIYAKNPYSFYRIFHIVSYSATTISSCICGIALLQANYQMFSPTRATDNTLSLRSFLQTGAFAILIFLTIFIIYILLTLARISIFGESRSAYMKKNFRHVLERIVTPILFLVFAFLMWYIA